jgi:poly(hydroxyalkanoate) depolymerase family esterase
MSEHMQEGMAEVMRLTREGRLTEATAVIQRTLGGGFTPEASPGAPGSADESSETPRGALNEAARATTAPWQASTTKKRTPQPPRGFRGMEWPPSGLPNTMPRPAEGDPTSAVVPAGGQFVERSYTNRAGTRAYKLYIPSGYVGQAVPLVVMLHGCTQNPDDFATGTHMNALAEEHIFLVAYPAQAQNANMSGCWNWFQAADQRRGQGEPSIIAGITCEVVGEYHIDPSQVYVAGMSAGGAMAAIMGVTYPDLYAAVGVHSGLAPGAAQDLSSAFTAMQRGGAGTVHQDTTIGETTRTVPVIVFHGDRDTTVHPQNADHLLARYRADNPVDGREAKGKPAAPVTVTQGQVPGGYAYTCATRQDADGRAMVEQWTIHGLGHAWSGGSRAGSYTDPKGPDASAEMLRFFDQHQKPMEQTTE